MRITICLLLVTLTLGCNNNEKKLPEERKVKKKEIQVGINKNIETIGIILNLSDMGTYILENFAGNGKNYSFVKGFRKKFEDYVSHPAVLKANKLGELNLLQFGYYYYGLSYSELPEFKLIDARFDEFYLSKTLTKEQIDYELNEFDSLVKDFYVDAQLDVFFAKENNFYNRILSEIKETLPNDVVSTMEDYFGERQNEYSICPSPTIFTGFNFGTKTSSKGVNTMNYLSGPAYDIDTNLIQLDFNLLEDSLGFNDRTYITDLAIHEFGHTFMRFLDKDASKVSIEKLSYLNTDELKSNLEQIGEGTDWSTGFEEHLVRASEIMVWRKLGMKSIADEKLHFELENEGFLYIHEFVNSLEKYESNRQQYRSLESYFEELITDLSKIKGSV